MVCNGSANQITVVEFHYRVFCRLLFVLCDSRALSAALIDSREMSATVVFSILADFRRLPSALVSSRRIITGSNASWEAFGLGGPKKQLILVRLHWHSFDIHVISVFASELNREWILLHFILLQSCGRDGKASGRDGTVAYKYKNLKSLIFQVAQTMM